MKKIIAILLLIVALAAPGMARAQSSFISRITGLTGNVAIKAPVKAATTGPIVLSGAQTIDGIAVVDHVNDSTGLSPDRVLVKNQTDTTANGIYYVSSSGAWTRTPDFDGPGDVAAGTILVADYGSQAGLFQLTSTDPITIATGSGSAITFSTFSLAGANSIISQICTSTGSILYYNGSMWVCLAAGTNGQVLSQAAGVPHWSTITGTGTMTSLTCGTGLSGGTITTSGTCALGTIATNTFLANTTSGSAVPVTTGASAYLDAVFGTTRGAMLRRGSSTWGALSSSTTGQVPTYNGTDLVMASPTNNTGSGTLASTGDWSFPGGMMMKWGYNGSGSTSAVPITFSTAFPNACFSVTVTVAGVSDGKRSAGIVGTCSTTGFSFYTGEGSSGSESFPAYWMAVGD